MIKITIDDKRKIILDRYLYMAAYVLPFAPEDVLDTDKLEIDGGIVMASNFMSKSEKAPRNRTAAYKKLLKKYRVKKPRRLKGNERERRLKRDQLLAAEVIQKENSELYQFLYSESLQDTCEPPRINRKNLRRLLTTKMDELDTDLQKIAQNSKHSKDMLDVVFRYTAFSESADILKLLKDMNVSVCPYCNRQYTFTFSKDNKSSRPQLDHFYPKDKYPCFAVSFYNLIPSCALCNNAKSNSDIADKNKRILYPYSDEMGDDVRFETRYESGFRYLFGNKNAIDEFKLILNPDNGNLDEQYRIKVKNAMEQFNLEELYQGHKDYVLNLFRKNYIFSDAYIEMLCREFPDILTSREEVKSLLYLMDIGKSHWGERVLGKLTHDIDWEIHA